MPGENLPDLDAEQDEGDKEPQAPEPIPSLLPNCSPDDPECGDSLSLTASGNTPPTVSLTKPTNGATYTAPATININATASDSNGIASVAFFRNGLLLFKDITSPYSYTWTNVPAGIYSLTARATDTLGAISTSVPVNITVSAGTPTNQPPIARPGGPYTGAPGVAIQFNGSTSSDADGTITSYQWDFGDSTGGSGATTAHAYSATGQYTVRLTVTDNLGATNSATATATVTAGSNLSPISNPGGPYTGVPGVAVQFNGAGSFDPDGSITSYQWNFGDGATGTGATPTRAYASAGFYNVSLTVTDNQGATGNATTSVSVTNPTSGSDFSAARLDPGNRTGQPGEDLFSGNFNWSIALLGLKGRAGLDLGLSLAYNSLVWTRSGSAIKFNADNGFPGPGFRLGFPVIQQQFFNSQANKNAYLMIAPSGSRVELRQVGSTSIYESADSSYLQFDAGTGILRTTDGAQLQYLLFGNEYRCVNIKDRNGNFISVSYHTDGRINTITDTMARVITFNYDAFLNLNSIRQTWDGLTHTWATFGYANLTIQTNFSSLNVTGPPNGTTIPVLSQVAFHDGSRLNFIYNSWGQIYQITHYAADSTQLNYISYNLPLNASFAQSDCPRFTQRTDWARDWNTQGGTAIPVTTSFYFEPTGSRTEVTLPDGTVYKNFFFTSGWQRGLTSSTEIWSFGARKKWTSVTLTQDNTAVSYLLNPRVTETNAYDDANNRRRATIAYTSFGLPSDVREYAADAATVLRRTHTDYNLASTYVNRRIIGLPSEIYLYEGEQTALMSKAGYFYDDSTLMQATPAAPAQHDEVNYGIGFIAGRGNLTKMRRYDATSPTSYVEHKTGYDTAGNVVFARDPLDHQVSFSYADSFSDSINRNTFAYPTTVTDPEGYSSTTQYHYDMGVVKQRQNPKGAVVTTSYDTARRASQVASNNGGYTRWVYPAMQTSVQTFSLLQGTTEFYSTQVFDGAGRVRATASDFPNSTGRYRGQYIKYDLMGRAVSQSNPTEMTNAWVAAGDDAATGWVYSHQSYDWQGRPTISTNTDQTTKEVSYGGCGCAGGQVVTLRDERNRRQRMTYDVLGRMAKAEVLNFDQSVYSTTTNTYNARDQVTRVFQQQGSGGTGQETLMSYDGHGRLKTRKTPIESAACVYDYNADDTVFKRTDARGASSNYTYNARHLMTGISYTKPATASADDTGPTAIPNPGAVAFGYDQAGSRLWMTDGQGRTDYQYDTWSRLQWEERYITEMAKSFRLTYSYNLAGQLTSMSDPFNSAVSYAYNNAGALTGVTGSGYGSVTTFASNLQYRAWGALKHMNYGDGLAVDYSYNTRLQMGRYNRGGAMTDYNYFSDGRVKDARHAGNGNPEFDRSYSYDHAGRMTEGLSGRAARGLQPDPNEPDPYSQTYQYDVFSNLTKRTSSMWNHEINPFNGVYVNDRNTSWVYDEAGNLKNDGAGRVTTYDVANRVSRWESVFDTITQKYDGDGRAVRRVETRSDPLFTSTIYYLRSSVMGGLTIAEINTSGKREVGYVYANGMELARYRKPSSSQSFEVQWSHAEPMTGDRIEGGVSITTDPLGGLVPGSDPFVTPDVDYGDLLEGRTSHTMRVFSLLCKRS